MAPGSTSTELSREGIPGYDYGRTTATSPISLEDLQRLKDTVLFTEDDVRHLRMAGDVLRDQVDAILDVWYEFVGSHEHLVHYFSDAQGRPVPEYLERVRKRFGQWILDTCNRDYDQEWLDYQYEIAHRHYRTKKNRTDGVESVPLIHLRYILAFIYPIAATIKPFLAANGHSAEDVEAMHQAWFKSIALQATLWSHPFAKEGDF